MAYFFADITSFTSWLNSKTESELRTMLTRADPRSRLNGSKSVLVRRVLDTTRSLGREEELRVFPELRRRRQQDDQRSGRVPTGQSREGFVQTTEGRRSAGRIALRNRDGDGPIALPRLAAATTSEVRTHQRGAPVSRLVPRVGQVAVYPRPQADVPNLPRGRGSDVRPPPQVQQLGRARTTGVQPSSSSNRPLPFFRLTTRPSAEPVTEATFSTPLRQGFHNPRAINSDLAGNTTMRTPEQVLQERLEVHAGLIIQSITNSLTPRNRRNSMSMIGAGAGSSSRSRPASTSSAEKMGPSVSVGEKEDYKSMLECKICFDDAVNTVLLPCGHACCCKDCSVRLKFATWDSKCPICRAKIQNISMLYFS